MFISLGDYLDPSELVSCMLHSNFHSIQEPNSIKDKSVSKNHVEKRPQVISELLVVKLFVQLLQFYKLFFHFISIS